MFTVKLLIPLIVGLVLGIGGYVTGVHQVSSRPVQVNVKPCPTPICPSCPSLGNEIEKIKGKNITIHIDEKVIYQANGDSLFREHLIQDMEGIIGNLKLARCK
jgi:hypothetical protein